MGLYYELDKDVAGRYEIQELIEPCSGKSSSWWSSLPAFTGGITNLKDFVTAQYNNIVHKNDFKSQPTAKVCPGIHDLFNNSLLVKFTTDLVLETTASGAHGWFVPDIGTGTNVLSHAEVQFKNEKSNLFDNYINIKFETPLKLYSSNSKTFVLPLDPFYHKQYSYKVMPGVIQIFKNTCHGSMLVNTLFPKIDAKYSFKAGDPMCYLYVVNNDNTLKEIDKKKNYRTFAAKKFLNSYRYEQDL